MSQTATPNRTALGLLLDATELMISRDVSQGRSLEQTRGMFEAANAALSHVAQGLGLTPPTDLEKLKAAFDALVAKAGAASAPVRYSTGLSKIAGDWFDEHPYDDDELTDEGVEYFRSFDRVAAPVRQEDVDETKLARQRLLASMMEALLIDQGMQPHEFDEPKARVILSNLRNAAARQAAVIPLQPRMEANADAAIAAFRERVTGSGKKGKKKP